MANFLLEVGCEPIPPQFVKPAAIQLRNGLLALLEKNKITFDKTRLYHTSRRIGIYIEGLPKKQEEHKTEIQGPPEKQAFDKKGKPTKVLKGYLKSKKLKRKDVSVRKTEKGRYVFVTKKISGRYVNDILSENTPGVLNEIEFPKLMIWNDSRVNFIRPIRWICALLDDKVCSFKFGGIKSGKKSRGYLISNKTIRIAQAKDYVKTLRKDDIVVDPKTRRKMITQGMNKIAKSLNTKPAIDDVLLDNINDMVEQPQVAQGAFPKKYLQLPEPIIKRAIRDIQHCIPLEKNRKLSNKYVIVMDAKKQAVKNTVKGYDQAIEAILSDAQFYYQNDLALGLAKMVKKEDDVVWLAGKGTLREKTDRLIQITYWISSNISFQNKALKRAAFLAKADLTSNLIREKDFTALQGIAGSFYAQALGEKKEVYQAIGEQYLPNYIGDKLPKTIIGSILSIADRIDNIAAAFAIGKIPSGSQDPLAIRKQAYGMIEVMVDKKISIAIDDFVDFAKKFYPELKDKEPGFNLFFAERVKKYLQDRGIEYDIVEAVIDVCLDPYDALLRCKALHKLRRKKEFETLIIGQKRVANILKGVKAQKRPKHKMFKESMERKLFDQAQRVEKNITKPIENKEYGKVLKHLLTMRKIIDDFFDEVLVMHQNKNIRKNRLALVNYVRTIFTRCANFSKIVIPGIEDDQK